MSAQALTSQGYIKHHLTNMTYGKLPAGSYCDGEQVLAEESWRLAHCDQQVDAMGFAAVHLDCMGWAMALGLVFSFLFSRMAGKAAANTGAPTGWQNLVEMIVEFIDGTVNDIFHHKNRLVAPMALTIFTWIFLMNNGKRKLYRSVIDESRPKHYALTMLPYPSGDLHIGHWYAMTPSDARARFKRMQGYNVLFPMGFDAFGLPAENAAIRDGIHPMKRKFENIERMRNQMKSMGAMFDWEREAVSADPSYYKWTEWFFIQLYKAGLAYRKKSAVDWCPNCNTTLAREQVWGENRVCERCGTPVIKKDLEQWFFQATRYADEWLRFDEIDWPQTVRTLQTNWIGRSEGAVIFSTSGPC